MGSCLCFRNPPKINAHVDRKNQSKNNDLNLFNNKQNKPKASLKEDSLFNNYNENNINNNNNNKENNFEENKNNDSLRINDDHLVLNQNIENKVNENYENNNNDSKKKTLYKKDKNYTIIPFKSKI